MTDREKVMGGWEQVHRRHRLVHAVAADVERLGNEALTGWESEIVAEYGELAAFLLDVQRRCHEAVYARLDLVLEDPSASPERDVRRTLAEAGRAHRALWGVLRACAGHPALAAGEARLRRSVFAATGVDPAPPRRAQPV
ncbi:hypothetical protein [Prauserella sp. PE36]|uniref:hypothetical protein n=1 Tax=Prauserella sp. PE36 TaxID=1504709 RepID=UPI000DE5554A|nr:hypothetical protein [Prauserella sp. PE36]